MSTVPRHFHIAAGCLLNGRGEVLICQRPAHKLYPGAWEFPGGKVEPGETVQQALTRELHEELGITVGPCRPLIRLRHAYPELSVDLDTWLVTGYRGEVRSTEHPEVAWVAPGDLPKWPLLAADQPIVKALRLPDQCVVTPPDCPADVLVAALGRLPANALLRLRLPTLADADYAGVAAAVAPALARRGMPLMLDRDPSGALGAGFHATSARLRGWRRRPVAADRWFGASCHSAADLARARKVDADYALLGPVFATPTHPDGQPLGWSGFRALARYAGLPVYAIGGVDPQDLVTAWENGAQGVAGISAYWSS